MSIFFKRKWRGTDIQVPYHTSPADKAFGRGNLGFGRQSSQRRAYPRNGRGTAFAWS